MSTLAVELDGLGAVLVGVVFVVVGVAWFRFRRDPSYEDPAVPGLAPLRKREATFPPLVRTFSRFSGQVFIALLGVAMIVGGLAQLLR